MNEELNLATQYDGTFDLNFLAPGETVRKNDNDSVFVNSRGKDIRVGKGEWLIRTPSGVLVVCKEI